MTGVFVDRNAEVLAIPSREAGGIGGFEEDAADPRDAFHARSPLFAVLGIAVAHRVGFLAAYVRTVLRLAVIDHAFFVIDV